MRICFVIDRLAGVRGGAERVLLELGAEMQRRGHSVSVVSFDSGRTDAAYPTQLDLFDLTPPTQRPVDETVKAARTTRALIKRVRSTSSHRDEWMPEPNLITQPLTEPTGSPSTVNKVMWRSRVVPKIASLRRWLAAHPQDTVVAVMPTAIAVAGTAVAELDEDRPRFIASTHSLPNLDFGDKGRFDPNPLVRRAAFDGLRQSDAITVLQPALRDLLPPELSAKAHVLPNPIPATAFGDDQREDLVIGVGRLTTIKRFDWLVEAFGMVADEFPSWRLEICGDGPQLGPLREVVSERGLEQRVRFNGSVPNIDDVYSRAKVLVHPALFEGFGLVMAEAITRGVSVVCSKRLHSADLLIDDGVTGFLADDSPEGFAKAMRRAFLSQTPRDDFQAAAERLYRTFEPHHLYDEWESLLIGQSAKTKALT